MRDVRLRLALAFALVALLLGILTLVFWNFVRDSIIVPIYYTLWIGGLVIRSIPQAAFLTVLLLICGLVGVNALFAALPRGARRGEAASAAAPETRYRHWERLCANLYLSRFSRQIFLNDARRLILSVLCFEYHLNSSEIEALLNDSQIRLPDSIRRLMDGDEDLLPGQPLGGLSQWGRRLRGQPIHDPQIDALLEEIIAFIETRLEIMHVGNPLEPRP